MRSTVGCCRFVAPLLLVVAALASSASGEEQIIPEYNAKAGFLTTFTNYATWPADAFAAADSPVIICILGRDPFGDVLDKTAAATRGVRPIVVRRGDAVSVATDCHVVFVAKAEAAHEAAWLAALQGRPILVVGESGKTLIRGGIVEFAASGSRITFDVNLRAARDLRLVLSSDLLAHAKKVYR